MALRLSQQSAVLVDESLAAEDDVLRALPIAATAIDIAADAARALLRQEALQVGVFAYGIAVGTEVENDVRAREGQGRAGRHRCPEVFAKFHAKHAGRGVEEQAGADLDLLSADEHSAFRHIGTALEPALLVELLVVGQEGLRHEAEYLAALHDGSTVEQGSAIRHRQADDTDDVEAAGDVHQVDETHLSLVQQELLPEQVSAGIGSDGKLRQTDDFYPLALSLNDERLNLLYVVLAVSNPHQGNG